jgi:hypothetical protein
MGKRGELTDEIKAKAKQLLSYEISRAELRLMPYMLYVMINEQHIDIDKINQEERQILSKWRNAGHIEGGASQMGITRAFYDIICELVFMAYVDIT